MPASIPASKLKLRRQEPTEHAIQDAILRYLAVDRRVAWAKRINSGAHTAESVNAKGKPVRRFVRYGFPGCSDILGQLTDGRLLAIECKSRRGKLTDEQAAFLITVQANGGVAFVARNIEDVQEGLAGA
jgi:hypothetical protein